jgi:hypothetical protein
LSFGFLLGSRGCNERDPDSNRIGAHTRISDRPFLGFLPLLDSLIERLKHARVYGGDDVHGGIQFFFGHPRFPCVRKAPIHSGIAELHHCDRQSDQHLFPFGETFDSMRIAVKRSKISFFHRCCSSYKGAPHAVF